MEVGCPEDALNVLNTNCVERVGALLGDPLRVISGEEAVPTLTSDGSEFRVVTGEELTAVVRGWKESLVTSRMTVR